MVNPAVALVVSYPPHVHGGYNESLSLLQDARRAVEQAGGRPLVVASDRAAWKDLRRRGYDAQFFKPTPRDRWREIKRNFGVDFLRPVRSGKAWTVESELRDAGTEFVMFMSPSWWGGALETLPFSTVVWDVSHLDEPSLLEVREGGEFTRRERFLTGALKRSEFVVVPDTHVQDSLVGGSYVSRRRVLIRPFQPPPLATDSVAPSNDIDLLVRKRRPLVFYPAYHWPHKCHRQLIEAMAMIEGPRPTLVLTGGDRANELRALADNLSVSDLVVVLGSISDIETEALYKGADVVAMPTLLGPSNLPPLEAWRAGTPLVYNRDFASFAQTAAEYVDPLDPHSIAAGISRALQPIQSANLVASGYRLLDQRAAQKDQVMVEISTRVSRVLQRS